MVAPTLPIVRGSVNGGHGPGKLRDLVVPDGPQIEEHLPFPDPGDHAKRPPAQPLFQDRFRNPRMRNGDEGGRKEDVGKSAASGRGAAPLDGEGQFASGGADRAHEAARPGADALLGLEDADGNELARDDDSGGERNSRLVYEVTAGRTYHLRVGSFGSDLRGGAYTLSIRTAVTPT